MTGQLDFKVNVELTASQWIALCQQLWGPKPLTDIRLHIEEVVLDAAMTEDWGGAHRGGSTY